MTLDYRFRALEPVMAPSAAAMTFPAYRHMLGLEPTARILGAPGQREVSALGVTVWRDGDLVGLGLAEVPKGSDLDPPEVLSLFVRRDHRNRGLATRLLEGLEQEIGRRGFDAVEAVYMTGKPSIPALERVLSRSGWAPPEVRTLSVRFTPDEMARAPWFGAESLPAGCELLSWTELAPEAIEEAKRSHAETPWVPAGLEPWRHGPGCDPVSSLALRLDGQIAGWIINHHLAPDAVGFTCSFVRRDLAPPAALFVLFTESIGRLRGARVRLCALTVPAAHRESLELVRRHCVPYAGFCAETRGSWKRLAGQPVAGDFEGPPPMLITADDP
jgi:GNAT superfamily N-acetyltransferase